MLLDIWDADERRVRFRLRRWFDLFKVDDAGWFLITYLKSWTAHNDIFRVLGSLLFLILLGAFLILTLYRRWFEQADANTAWCTSVRILIE